MAKNGTAAVGEGKLDSPPAQLAGTIVSNADAAIEVRELRFSDHVQNEIAKSVQNSVSAFKNNRQDGGLSTKVG